MASLCFFCADNFSDCCHCSTLCWHWSVKENNSLWRLSLVSSYHNCKSCLHCIQLLLLTKVYYLQETLCKYFLHHWISWSIGSSDGLCRLLHSFFCWGRWSYECCWRWLHYIRWNWKSINCICIICNGEIIIRSITCYVSSVNSWITYTHAYFSSLHLVQ